MHAGYAHFISERNKRNKIHIITRDKLIVQQWNWKMSHTWCLRRVRGSLFSKQNINKFMISEDQKKLHLHMIIIRGDIYKLVYEQIPSRTNPLPSILSYWIFPFPSVPCTCAIFVTKIKFLSCVYLHSFGVLFSSFYERTYKLNTL